jgi:hypothetical protein
MDDVVDLARIKNVGLPPRPLFFSNHPTAQRRNSLAQRTTNEPQQLKIVKR